MAVGDQDYFLRSIKQTLPHWFGNSETPILDAILKAYAWAGSFLYSQLAYVRLQTRIKTATDDNLELIADDFFGPGNFPRDQGESDDSYRNRILINIIQERVTRAAIIKVLERLTGRTPKIFEPGRPADTGGYRVGGVGYGVAGGYGSILLHAQFFVTAYRPNGNNLIDNKLAKSAGYGVSVGGYGVGAIQFGSISMLSNLVTDAQIYQAVNITRAAGVTAWVQIQD